MMISYSELLKVRGQQGLSETEVQAILKTVLMQLVTLHCQGKAHQQISLETLQQDGEQTVLLPKDNPNVNGSPSQDIYDLGLVVLELLTGQVPNPLRTNPTWDWNDHCLISDQLNAILKRMVTPNPSQRWQNATQLLSAMGVAVPEVPSIEKSPRSAQASQVGIGTTFEKSPPSLKAWQLGLVGAGTILVVVVGGLGIGSLFIPALRPFLASAISSSQSDQEDAVMFRGNLERTGVYPPGGPTELTQLVWKFKFKILSSPTVSGGVIYFGSSDNHLYAVDANTGQERWKFTTQGTANSSPAVSGGVVYLGSGNSDNHLYAVDAKSGQERWKFRTQGAIDSSPAVSGGVVYAGSSGGHLYAVDVKTGEERWKFRAESSIRSSPSVSEGVVYVGSDDNHLYAVDANTGQERWKFRAEGMISSSPSVSGGVVYFGSWDGLLYAVDANTGQERWKFRTEHWTESSPAVSGGIVYVGSWNGYLYAVDANTGQERWKFKTEEGISSSPSVSGDMVYVGSWDNHLYAVDANTGQERWKFKTEDGISSSPSVSEGVLYFGSMDGYLYAVK